MVKGGGSKDWETLAEDRGRGDRMGKGQKCKELKRGEAGGILRRQERRGEGLAKKIDLSWSLDRATLGR